MKRTNRLLPPVYFLSAMILMVLLRLFLPIMGGRWWPWHLGGAVLIFLGAALNIAADNQLKQHNTTVKPFQPSKALVTEGVFRFSRNPMYLGMVGILTGLGILLASLTPFLVIPIFAWWLTIRFIVPEEQSLMEQFGPAYLAYKTQVRRWL